MSAGRRRRVMLESDDEDDAGVGEQGLGEVSVTPHVTPPTAEQTRPSKSRRSMKVIAADEDDDEDGDDDGSGGGGLFGGSDAGGESAGGGDEQEDDEAERKRRRQLAERWSKLEEDSDHDLSDGDGDDASGAKRSSLVQLQFHETWGRGSRSRTASRRLVKEPPPSGDEVGDSSDSDDGLGGFIVDSEDEQDVDVDGGGGGGGGGGSGSGSTKKRKGKQKSAAAPVVAATFANGGGSSRITRKSGRRKSGANACEIDDDEDHAEAASRADGHAAASASKKRRNRGKSQPEEDEEGDGRLAGRKRARRSKASARVEAAAAADGDGEEEENDKPVRRSSRAQKGKEVADEEPGSGKRRKTSAVGSEPESAGPSSSDDDDDDDDSDEEFSMQPAGSKKRGKGTRKDGRTRGRSGEEVVDVEEASPARVGTRGAGSKNKGKGKGKGKGKSKGKSGGGGSPIVLSSQEEEEEVPVKAVGKGKKKAKEKVGRGKDKQAGGKSGGKDIKEEAPAAATGRATRTRRRSSMVNYREMLHGKGTSSSEEDDGNGGGGGGEDDSGWDNDDDDESDGDLDGKKSGDKCARDQDIDEDDSFAVTLKDDDEEEEEEEEEEEIKTVGSKGSAGCAKRSRSEKNEGGSGSKRKGRKRNHRYNEPDDDDEDNFIDDDDDDDDDDDEEDGGDAFFSHAAFFNEMEQSEDGGISSLSVGTMTFKEAFLFYVEYIAKATQGDGAGEAFMKKYVAQPRIPEHARYGKAKEMVEKKLRISGESLCGSWRQDFRDTIMRYPHYGYHHVDGDLCRLTDRCSACNRSNRTSVIAFLSGSEYDPNRVWDGLRWDKHLPEHWDDPDAAAVAKQEAKATHYLGDTCKHKSHLFHSLTHYKLYLVSKVSAKIRGDSGLEPENFRGEGGPQTSKKKKKRCLNFSENEFESLSALLRKADDLNGVKWGGRAGVRGGHGKTFLEMGAASSILDWLSGEAQQGQYGDLDLGELEGQRPGLGEEGESEDEDEEEFHVGRGRRWRTVGSSGGRYG